MKTFSPQDTVLQVYLFQGSDLGTTANADSSLVKDAQVIISDGNAADTLMFNSNTRRYEGRKKNPSIEPLRTYFLVIQTAAGKVLKASCSIPPAPPIPQITGYREQNDYFFKVSWSNPTGFKYFSLTPFALGTIEVNSIPSRSVPLNARLLDDVSFPSDEQRNLNSYQGIVPQAYAADNPKLRIILRHIEKFFLTTLTPIKPMKDGFLITKAILRLFFRNSSQCSQILLEE